MPQKKSSEVPSTDFSQILKKVDIDQHFLTLEIFRAEPEMEPLGSCREWAQTVRADSANNPSYLVFHFSCHIRAKKVKN